MSKKKIRAQFVSHKNNILERLVQTKTFFDEIKTEETENQALKKKKKKKRTRIREKKIIKRATNCSYRLVIIHANKMWIPF